MDQNGDRSRPPTRLKGAEPEASEPELPPGLDGGLELDIVRDAGDWTSFEPAETTIERVLQAAARHPRVATSRQSSRPKSVCIALTSDAAVRELNRSWRAKDTSTNVLSFPAPDPPAGLEEAWAAAGPLFLGDVVLAAETIHREAHEMDLTPHHHLQHLVVHGLLHLLGFDHEGEAEATDMETLETEILASIGVADPYARSDR